MYFKVNFNVFFKLIKVHLLVSELYITVRSSQITQSGSIIEKTQCIPLRILPIFIVKHVPYVSRLCGQNLKFLMLMWAVRVITDGV